MNRHRGVRVTLGWLWPTVLVLIVVAAIIGAD